MAEKVSQQIIEATKNGDIDKIQQLLTIPGINLNIKDKNYLTPVLIAARNNRLDILKKLIDADADINSQTNNGTTALIMASVNNNLDIVKELLKHPNIKPNIINVNGLSALVAASYIGNIDIVKELIAAGVNINIKTNDGGNALLAALGTSKTENLIEIVKELIIGGIDVNIKTNSGKSPLIVATSRGELDIVKELLKHPNIKVDITLKNGYTALIAASYIGNKNIVNELINAGANVNIRTDTGFTALIEGARSKNIDIVNSLITAGADPNLQEYKIGLTALMYLADFENINIAKLLLDNNANPNIKTYKGYSALIRAIIKNNTNFIKLLLQRDDIDINSVMRLGGEYTPLMVAAELGNLNIIKMLLKDRRVLINQYNAFGLSAYLIAAEKGDVDVIRAFHDPTITDREEPNIAPRIGRIVTKVNTFLEDKTIKNPINIEANEEDSISLEKFKEGDEVVRIRAADDTGKIKDWFYHSYNWVRWVRLKASYDQLPTNPTTGLTVTPDQVDIFTAHIVPQKDEFSMVGGYRHTTRRRRRI